MKQLLRRVWYFIRQRRLEDELAEEMEFHRAMKQRELEHGGLARADAEALSRRLIGNSTLAREDSRAIWIWPWLESVWQDAAYAARNLRRQPGFTAVVLAVLTTVIGLNATLFTIVAGVLIRPWPGVRDPSGLVHVYLISQNGLASGFSLRDSRSLAGSARSLKGVVAMTEDNVRIESADATSALIVTGHFFDVLGVTMARGRGFGVDEDELGAPRAVVILAYDFWHSRFGGDTDIVGTSVRINDVPFTIVGIASREFASAEPAYAKSVFLPMAAMPLLHPGDARYADLPEAYTDVAARLAPGTTREQARAEIELLSRDFLTFAQTPPRSALVTGTEFLSHPGRIDSTQALVTVALVSTGLLIVWLIACANVGNLLLARAAARMREIGIRLSLGASRRRIVRQLVTEGLVLALVASALGVALAYELPFVVFRIVANDGVPIAFPFSVTPDAAVVGYAILIAGASSLAFSLAPALHATRVGVVGALNESEGLPSSRFPLRGLLLGIQVALSVTLLLSAGLLVRGVQRQSQSFTPGFSFDDVAAVSFELPAGAYDEARTRTFFANLGDAFRASNAGAYAFASAAPFSRFRFASVISLPGDTTARRDLVQNLEISAGYIGLLRIPILAGRDFTDADTSRPVVLINESMAQRYWPADNPVGKTFFVPRPGRLSSQRTLGTENLKSAEGPIAYEVEGVVRNVHVDTAATVPPMFYRAFAGDVRGELTPKLLMSTNSTWSISSVAAIVARLDPRVRVQMTPLRTTLDGLLAASRWGPILAAVLGGFALALSAVGMFGVFAYAVRQRTREIGIRMALGARPAAVVGLILTGHSRAVLGGLGMGWLGALAASAILRSRLHGISPLDPVVYLGVFAALALAGLVASYLPARRATRVDPVVALRCD